MEGVERVTRMVAIVITLRWSRSLYRNIYFAALVGATAGLCAWGASSLLLVALGVTAGLWVPDTVAISVFSVFTAMTIFIYADAAVCRRWRSIGLGLCLGMLAALVATTIVTLVRLRIQDGAPTLFRLLAWAVAGSASGAAVGLRWARSNRVRILHTYIGGLAGGLAGGLVFVLLGPHVPELSQACGFMLMGAGTGCGALLAPFSIRQGALEFISSGDARAQSKLGRSGNRWMLEHDERYLLGNLSNTDGPSVQNNGVDIFIPDASLAAQHAVLFSREGRYFVARHPDAGGAAGIAKYVLRVRNKTVVASDELHDLDDILVGKTSLRFSARKPHIDA